jgi:hypothetical protein
VTRRQRLHWPQQRFFVRYWDRSGASEAERFDRRLESVDRQMQRFADLPVAQLGEEQPADQVSEGFGWFRRLAINGHQAASVAGAGIVPGTGQRAGLMS